MNKIELILVGGGGHCNSVIESIESTGKYNIIGISDHPEMMGKSIQDYRVIATDLDLPKYVAQDISFLVTVGQIKNPQPRLRLFNLLDSISAKIVTIIDSDSNVSKHTIIGKGSVILRNAFINSGASIGYNCIINTGAIVEHDCKIGNNVHVSTGAIINGDCTIGDNCFIGSGAVISNNITLTSGTIIAAGAIVLRSITTEGTYIGNPARRIK